MGHVKAIKTLWSSCRFSELLIGDNTRTIASGGGPFNDNENALIDKFNIPHERIKHMSGSDEILLDLYARALVFVYPSIYEGFGFPSAMANGCPSSTKDKFHR